MSERDSGPTPDDSPTRAADERRAERTSARELALRSRGLSDAEPPRKRLRRKKVVLAERPGAQRIPRVVGEQEEIPGGEGLVRWLIGKQLRVAIPLATGTAVVLIALPALFAYVPSLAAATVFGLSLPWLVLGALVYPAMVGVGIWHNRLAERNEKDFIDSLDD